MSISARKKIQIRCVTGVQNVVQEVFTVAAHLQIDDISNANVDNAKEALILLLEFLLVKDLNRQDAVFVDFPVGNTHERSERAGRHCHQGNV